MKLAVAVRGIAPSFPDTTMEALVAHTVSAVKVSTKATDTSSRENLRFIAGPFSQVGMRKSHAQTVWCWNGIDRNVFKNCAFGLSRKYLSDYASKNADELVVLLCFQENFLIEERAGFFLFVLTPGFDHKF
ncbi:MAG: hypothetical protein PHS17_01050 [Desulfobacterales bacterium]|nr:hypothetical protein [Desulfobacterales bacterium]